VFISDGIERNIQQTSEQVISNNQEIIIQQTSEQAISNNQEIIIQKPSEKIISDNETANRKCRRCLELFSYSNNSGCRYHDDILKGHKKEKEWEKEHEWDQKKMENGRFGRWQTYNERFQYIYRGIGWKEGKKQKEYERLHKIKWTCCKEFRFKLKPGHERKNEDDFLLNKSYGLVDDHSSGCKQCQAHEEPFGYH